MPRSKLSCDSPNPDDMEHLFIQYAYSDPRLFFSWVIVVCFSICVHEWAHADMALRCGDDTATRAGHLSLNPMVQMGIGSLVMLAMFGIAWGAVPVDVSRLRRRTDGALVSFAGPAANLVLALAFSLLFVGLAMTPLSTHPLENILRLGCMANGVLFLFNMLPVPMFDGWSVFSLWFPAMRRVRVDQAQTFGGIFLLMVFVTPLGAQIWKGGSAIGDACVTLWLVFFALIGM